MPVILQAAADKIEMPCKKRDEGLPAFDQVDLQLRPVVETFQDILIETLADPCRFTEYAFGHIRADYIGKSVLAGLEEYPCVAQRLQQARPVPVRRSEIQLLPVAELHL